MISKEVMNTHKVLESAKDYSPKRFGLIYKDPPTIGKRRATGSPRVFGPKHRQTVSPQNKTSQILPTQQPQRNLRCLVQEARGVFESSNDKEKPHRRYTKSKL
eukprot:TRINITY_DN3741_c0_g1_i5.p3 TRINITY_DN3741_c0_g1~~TRINITY_DN3741_c0_g1_i5.p3  ORF type:complete len:103 (-),score=0.40 TRINITY_DN3741_c0_g1_i5:416-724(-)